MTRAAIPSSASASAAFSASCTVMPGADQRHLVVVARAQHPAAADCELLVRRVQDRRRGTERPQVRDALRVGHAPRRASPSGSRRTDGAPSTRGSRGRTRCPRDPSGTGRPRRSRRPHGSRRARASRGSPRPCARSRTRARGTPRTSRRTAASRPPAGRPRRRPSAARRCTSRSTARGVTLANVSANVEFETSPSRTTTSGRAAPSAASASPYAFRVATSVPSS